MNAALQPSRWRFTHSHLTHSFLHSFCTYMCPSKQSLSFPCDVLIISIITVVAVITSGLAIYATICVLIAGVHAMRHATCDFDYFDTAEDMHSTDVVYWTISRHSIDIVYHHRRLMVISMNTYWVILLYVPPKSLLQHWPPKLVWHALLWILMNHSVACWLLT